MHKRLVVVGWGLLLLGLWGCPAPPTSPTAGSGTVEHKALKVSPEKALLREKEACQRKAAALEAEVARLERQSKGEPAPAYKIVNGHEHMMSLEHLETYYLPSARAAGIVSTVMVASPKFTLFGKGNDKGQPGMEENFQEILKAAQKYPGEIIPFTAVDPTDPDKLERLKRHVAQGAKGVKLYSGHTNFFDKPLNDPDMDPIYAYIEQQGLPLCWHVNLPTMFDQFEAVMKAHPKLNVQIPHYGVLFWKPGDTESFARLHKLMRDYPSIYLDTSLGTRKILVDGLEVIGHQPQPILDLFKEFPDRFTWGTDGVVTGNAEKTGDWWSKVIGACRDQLERNAFYFAMGAGFSKYWHKSLDTAGTYAGLALPPETLKKIYEDNPRRWLAGGHSKG